MICRRLKSNFLTKFKVRYLIYKVKGPISLIKKVGGRDVYRGIEERFEERLVGGIARGLVREVD